jgi:hypothetical protein
VRGPRFDRSFAQVAVPSDPPVEEDGRRPYRTTKTTSVGPTTPTCVTTVSWIVDERDHQ